MNLNSNGWKNALPSPSFILSRMTGKNSCTVALPGSYSKTVGGGGGGGGSGGRGDRREEKGGR